MLNENRAPLVQSANNQAAQLPNTFELLQSDFLQLSPYGNFPHPRGLQRVDREAADIMVKRFNSFRGKLGRLFGGAPFYVGHPDTPHASDLADKKAYGWVMELEAREDGIYGRVKWSQAGLDLLKNAHFKYLSPYWEAHQISSETGRPIFRPTNLISVGLTNQPNLPVKPLANSGPRFAERTSLSGVLNSGGPGRSTDDFHGVPNIAPLVAVSCESAALATPQPGGANERSPPPRASAGCA